jgi:hypothetical protein
MGKTVMVNEIYNKEYNEGALAYNKVRIDPSPAWITGFSNIKEGNIYDLEGSKYFHQNDIIPCVKVRFFYKEKEVNIPYDEFELTNEIPYSLQDEISKEYNYEMYHANKKAYPRDSKGRFVKVKRK